MRGRLIEEKGPAAISNDPASEEVLELAITWLRTCVLDHPQCQSGRKEDAGFMPTRVIDVGRSDGIEDPKLLETNGQQGPYVTLSYVWGKAVENQKTTRANKADRIKGIPFATMRKSLRDAVRITRKLGAKYLWVDALCIVQDDDHDKGNEMAVMHKIYKNSLVTIAAAGASSILEGCFLPRKNYVHPPPNCPLFVDGAPIWVCPNFPNRHQVMESQPMTTRAWIMQERFLSSRILFWTDTCLFWECSALEASENWPKGQPGVENLTNSLRQIRLHVPTTPAEKARYLTDIWSGMVSRYTRCEISYGTDKFPALSAVAHHFQQLTCDTYHAGLWASVLLQNLLWFGKPGMGAATEKRKRDGRGHYIAPSWSWGSVVGEIAMASPPPNLKPCAKVVAVETLLAGPDPYGEIKSGKLTLCGRLRRGLWAEPPPFSETPTRFHVLDRKGAGEEWQSGPWNQVTFDVESEQENFHCFEVQRSIKDSWDELEPVSSLGLALMGIGVSNVYKRIGYCEMSEWQFFEGCEEETVTII